MPKQPEVVSVSRAHLAALRTDELSDYLEEGRIVFFPEAPVALPSAQDLEFLRSELPKLIRLKNVSYYPTADRVYGMQGDRALRERVTALLKDHHHRVEDFLHKHIPRLAKDWIAGTASFRPLEEKGRNLSAHASNELLHIDSGAYGATHGDRIFRFFTNINTSKPRVWRVKGTFPDLYRELGPQAGIARPGSIVDEGLLDRVYSGMIRGLSAVLPMARSLDSSPYDRAMRRLHNYMKDSPEFQRSDDGARIVDFPPMSSWMVLTDMVGHSCIEGQHMLSDTFLIPLKNCLRADYTPYRLLQRGLPGR